MINILSTPKKDSESFWNEVDTVTYETLISMYEHQGNHSWTYNGKNIVWLEESPASEVLEFMKIHKALCAIPESFHRTRLHIVGDYYGIVPNAFKPYKVNFLDDGNEILRKKNMLLEVNYTIKEEALVDCYVLLHDHIDKLFDMDNVYDAYLLTKDLDTITLTMFDFMLKGMATALDVDYYFTIKKLTTCKPYTFIRVKRVDIDGSTKGSKSVYAV